jgi:hypothetical protein
LAGLLAGGVRSLNSFPSLAVIGDRQDRQKAMWELQMANEGFLKAFCLQNNESAGYRKIHSVPELLGDAAAVGLTFEPTRFSRWPEEREMFAFRYATGRRVSSVELFAAYELTLDLCHAVATSLKIGIDVGKGRFLIQPLPWRLKELGIDIDQE